MEYQGFTEKRRLKVVQENYDLVVVGGGLTGVCCAITAARTGIKVVLLQDRPVLGGNASSEVRLWALGATSHMGNNNRWAREGGVINEILTENIYRNKEGNCSEVGANWHLPWTNQLWVERFYRCIILQKTRFHMWCSRLW